MKLLEVTFFKLGFKDAKALFINLDRDNLNELADEKEFIGFSVDELEASDEQMVLAHKNSLRLVSKLFDEIDLVQEESANDA